MTHSMSPKPITLLLAEDHTIVREGLRALLQTEKDIAIVGEASNGREALVLARRLCPDVVLMDLAMPLLNGLEATRQIRKILPGAKVIILSAHSDDAYVEQAIASGATGYLLKQTSAHTLSEAVREVHKGNTFFCPVVTRQLHNWTREPASNAGRPKSQPPHLGSREVEVLQLIAEGHLNKQVAAALGISVKTVEKHRQRLMEKLHIHDTAGLTRYAIATGVIESSVQLTMS
jgi:DNA-binding NarL/FixJ family response regulator